MFNELENFAMSAMVEASEAIADLDETNSAEPIVKKYRSSIVKPKYRVRYAPLNDSCGDEWVGAFNDATKDDDGRMSLDALHAIGSQNGVDVAGRWGIRNPGQQRMNLGNVLRARFRKGEAILVGNFSFIGRADAAE